MSIWQMVHDLTRHYPLFLSLDGGWSMISPTITPVSMSIWQMFNDFNRHYPLFLRLDGGWSMISSAITPSFYVSLVDGQLFHLPFRPCLDIALALL